MKSSSRDVVLCTLSYFLVGKLNFVNAVRERVPVHGCAPLATLAPIPTG